MGGRAEELVPRWELAGHRLQDVLGRHAECVPGFQRVESSGVRGGLDTARIKRYTALFPMSCVAGQRNCCSGENLPVTAFRTSWAATLSVSPDSRE